MKRKRITSAPRPNKRRKIEEQVSKLSMVDHWYFPPFKSMTKAGKEVKFFDIVPSFGVVNVVPAVFTTSMVTIPAGIGPNDRIGRKITIRAIHCDWDHSVVNGTVTDPTSISRFWLILDKQCNGAVPVSSAEIFTTPTSIQLMQEPTNERRFTILKSHTSKLAPKTIIGGFVAQDQNEWVWFLKTKIPIEYTGVSGLIATLKSNNIFTFAGNNSLNTTQARMTGRVYYTDD